MTILNILCRFYVVEEDVEEIIFILQMMQTVFPVLRTRRLIYLKNGYFSDCSFFYSRITENDFYSIMSGRPQ